MMEWVLKIILNSISVEEKLLQPSHLVFLVILVHKTKNAGVKLMNTETTNLIASCVLFPSAVLKIFLIFQLVHY